MDRTEVDRLVRQLAVGFETLQDEYQKIHGQHQLLEKKLATAREQYNELAKLYGADSRFTPPLSLASAPIQSEPAVPPSASAILARSADEVSRSNAEKVRVAANAAHRISLLPAFTDGSIHGVKIWAGPSADKPEGASSNMPSISESPLEQDFTIEGKPSRLGCPFASMQKKKKLSSHAASVLSRYNASGSVGASNSPLSVTSRINGKDSISRRSSRRESFVDPIKAEICGLSDHHATLQPMNALPAEMPAVEDNPDAGVCPIRFLDQHSPEEVATYFERHKHELPRSHEVCVMRYQSNEAQIKQLDAKYGNLVSMIQGLGEKHKPMLPHDPDDIQDHEDEDVISDEKVRKWASSVSAQAAGEDPNDVEQESTEEREHNFERPLRDIRVGESPSRPWGISVPAKYLENADSETSSKPARFTSPAVNGTDHATSKDAMPTSGPEPLKCPFGHGSGPKPAALESPHMATPGQHQAQIPEATTKADPVPEVLPASIENPDKSRQMIFTGPVFIGYSAEDAARILRTSGLTHGQ